MGFQFHLLALLHMYWSVVFFTRQTYHVYDFTCVLEKYGFIFIALEIIWVIIVSVYKFRTVMMIYLVIQVSRGCIMLVS